MENKKNVIEIQGLEIKIHTFQYGWEEIEIVSDYWNVHFNASYLGQEPVASLIHAIYELEFGGTCRPGGDEVDYEYDIQWISEPGNLNMKFRRTGEVLNVHLTKALDYVDKVKFKEDIWFTIPFGMCKKEVIRVSLCLLKEYGICGYYESWSDKKDFPLGILFRLIIGGCNEDSHGKSISDLLSESCFLRDLANNQLNQKI